MHDFNEIWEYLRVNGCSIYKEQPKHDGGRNILIRKVGLNVKNASLYVRSDNTCKSFSVCLLYKHLEIPIPEHLHQALHDANSVHDIVLGIQHQIDHGEQA